jgi:hypothetical protein
VFVAKDAMDICNPRALGVNAAMTELDLRLAWLGSSGVSRGKQKFVGVGRQETFFVRNQIESLFTQSGASGSCGNWDTMNAQVVWGCPKASESPQLAAVFQDQTVQSPKYVHGMSSICAHSNNKHASLCFDLVVFF